MPISMPDTASFAFLREPRGPPPAVNLGPVNYTSKSLREIVPLKTAPESERFGGDIAGRPEPVEPKLSNEVHRGPPAKLTSSSISPSLASSSKRLYPLLTSGDTQYKLAPLKRIYCSPSPVSSRSVADGESSTSRDSSPASSPESCKIVLPSLRSITHMRHPSESEELARQVGKIELDRRNKEIPDEDRRKHAELIRNLLVSINNDYKRRFGVPYVKVKEEEDEGMNLLASESPRDVEMTLA